MSDFIHEYGKVILVFIVIACLVGFAFVVSKHSNKTASHTSDAFTNITEQQMDEIATDVGTN